MTQRHAERAAQGFNQQMMALEPIPPLDIMAMVRTLWHGKWLIMFTTICAIGLAGFYAFQVAQPRYGATATLQIDLQPTMLRDVSNQWPGPSTDLASLNTQVAMLTSDQVLRRVIDERDLLADPEFNRYITPAAAFSLNQLRTRLRHLFSGTTEIAPDNAAIIEKTIQNLRGVLTTQQPRDTHIFTITAQSGSPNKAALIANTVAQAYVANQVRARNAASHAAEQWLSSRVGDLQRQLVAQETDVATLIATAQIQADTALDRLSNAVLDVEQRIASARASLVQGQPQAANAANTTARLQAETAQQSKLVSELEAERDRLRDQLTSQSTGLLSLQQMQREADATRVLYETFLTRLQETRIQRGLEHPDSHLIAPAASARYIGPRKVFILTLAAMLGALAGLGLVALRHGLRKGIADASTLRQATGLPVLAQVPLQSFMRPQRLVSHLNANATSPLAEAVRAIRTSLFLAGPEQAPKVIMSTSSLPGEGKTTHAIALAHNLASLGKSVILIDCDLRKSAFPRFLLSRPNHGLEDAISGQILVEDCLIYDQQLQFSVLFGRRDSARNPADILASQGFESLMTALEDRYDHIILDAPAVLSAPDSLILAQHADAIIYAVNWAKTPVSTVNMGLQALEDVGASVAGLILSKMKMRHRGNWQLTPTQGPHACSP